jgi:serine/threonine-protein kinase RsbW
MAGEVARITVPCHSLAPALVRRRLAELSDLGWPLGDALLVATELVTNALRHSMCTDEDTLLVSVDGEADRVRIAVLDPGRSGGTARISANGHWLGGLGLKVVDQVSRHWGSNRSANGYEVWAELPRIDPQQGTRLSPGR